MQYVIDIHFNVINHLNTKKTQIHIRRRRRRTLGPTVQGPGVNEVSFRTRPHHNVHHTLGVDTGATSPL
jgi:hypothetical protein